MERLLLAAAATVFMAAWPSRRQCLFGFLVLLAFGLATASLTYHFLTDDFACRQVWLQSAPELAWWLKLANLWSGDEGTLLLLPMLSAALALPLSQQLNWAATCKFGYRPLVKPAVMRKAAGV